MAAVDNRALALIASFIAMVFVIFSYFTIKKQRFLLFQSLCIVFLIVSYFFTVQFFAMVGLVIGLLRAVSYFAYERQGRAAPLWVPFGLCLLTALSYAVINLGDKQAHYMGFAAAGNVYYYGRDPDAEFYIKNPICDGKTVRYSLQTQTDTVEVCFPAVGDFHTENSAAAIACALLEGISPQPLEASVKHLHTPAGRMEKIPLDTDFSVYIDYAHSPEALEKALSSLRPLTHKLTILFGAGGDRDQGKRPQMGATAEALADLVILTSDNPRGESPEHILDDIEKGMKKGNHIRVPDRREAILFALKQAESGEILLLAGKGHENYIIDKNGKHTFSEKEIIKNALGII